LGLLAAAACAAMAVVSANRSNGCRKLAKLGQRSPQHHAFPPPQPANDKTSDSTAKSHGNSSLISRLGLGAYE
jgi:hypothetical protein